MPDRPRLADHVRARRHLTADGSRVVLHDGDRALALGEREWCVARQMDGTRDLDGLRIATRAAGRIVSEAHLRAFVEQLGSLGLLESSPEFGEPAPEVSSARDLPVVGAPGRRFACTGAGGCCELFDTMLATPLEAMRARAICPSVADLGPALDDVFTSERGLDAPLLALPLGARGCAYVQADRRCALHAAAGPEAKPFSCRVHPMAYLDVGTEIRQSPRLSCACAFDNTGPPLEALTTGAQLDPRIHVSRLESVRAGGQRWPASRLLEWLASAKHGGDAAETFEQLARSLGPTAHAGRSAGQIEAQLRQVPPERRALHEALEAALAASRSDTPGSPRHADEQLYLASFVFQPTFAEPTLEAALDERARRIRLARRMDPEGPHPLATVEALARRGALL